MNVWSEKNKVVSVIAPSADFAAGDVTSDIVDMANYKKLTFIVATGATTVGKSTITVNAGISNASCATQITFKYRTQIAAIPPAAGSDVSSALTAVTVAATGLAMTASKSGGIYIVEVDADVVAAAGTLYDHVSITLTEDDSTAQIGCVLAILSEPRYPQDVLATAID